MLFEWDENKAKANFIKHRVLFETATLVFEDPYAVTRRDVLHSDDEQRFTTLGLVDRSLMLFVVLTYSIEGANESARIISARPAKARERRHYEEANGRAEKKYRRD